MSFNTDEAEHFADVLWTWKRGLLSVGGCPITNGQNFVRPNARL